MRHKIAAQDRVMSLRAREQLAPEMAIARQRAENDLADLERTRAERLAGLDRLMIVTLRGRIASCQQAEDRYQAEDTLARGPIRCPKGRGPERGGWSAS
jgi:hypothetical protein